MLGHSMTHKVNYTINQHASSIGIKELAASCIVTLPCKKKKKVRKEMLIKICSQVNQP